ncbi:gem associated protein 6 [Pelomyxa schiedti]|nr:gem associated protein 6 [Pelomyxa schiedti]
MSGKWADAPQWMPFADWDDVLGHIGCCVVITVAVSRTACETVTGFLYTIDPEAFHVILVSEADKGSGIKTTCVFSSTIQHMEVVSGSKCTLDLTGDDISVLWRTPNLVSVESLNNRKQALLQLLSEQRINFEEKEGGAVDVLGGALKIEQPYTPNSCYSSNSLLLERMQTLLRRCETLSAVSSTKS